VNTDTQQAPTGAGTGATTPVPAREAAPAADAAPAEA
jgi:hypothetical protein